MAAEPVIEWTKLIGTTGDDHGNALTAGADGAIYLGGDTSGDLAGTGLNGGLDAFITKYAPDGNSLWTRQQGTSSFDTTYALTRGIDGSIYAAGVTVGNLDGLKNFFPQGNGYIAKYLPDGTKVWTKLLEDSQYGLHAHALTTGLDGAIYVAGYRWGNLDGHTTGGGPYIVKYAPDGSKLWTSLLGTSTFGQALALTTGNDGSVYVAGVTNNAQNNQDNYDAFITKYTPDGTTAWTKLIGTTAYDGATALTVGVDGAIYVSGVTSGNLNGEANNGSNDAFITKYMPDGTTVWTKLLGTANYDNPSALTTGNDGAIYVAGYTNASLDGQTSHGADDAFVAKYTPDGTKEWTKQFGTANYDWAYALTTGIGGAIYVAGVTYGNFGGQTNLGNKDVFVTKLYEPVNAIYSDTSYSLSDGETKLVLTGTAAINGTGNALDNDIAGNSGANTLLGLSGNDTLKGGAGNDVLDGGAGIDTADYSDKSMSVSVNLRSPAMAIARVGDINEDRLTDIENLIGGSGDDALTGNGLVNVLIGGLGDDTLDGSGGADSLVGGAGNDIFVVEQTGDVVVELLGQGADQIRTSLTQIDLDDYDHVENLTYTGRSTSTLIGSDADNVIQGGARTDVIQGGLGSDTLYGGDGADVLMGSADDAAGSPSDRDRLLGGRGNDVYLLNGEADAAVQIIEYRGEGTDTVLGDLARYVMADHVENYVNDRAISQNGIFQYIEITGNSQNNIIRSAPNWDLIPKTAGLDWIATNIKRLMDSDARPSFISNEWFEGMGGNDTLLGGTGDDYLSGGAGRDQLTGGAGLDKFVFDAALNRTSNVDIITDFMSGQDKIVLDRTVFTRFSVGENVADHLSTTGRPLDRDDYLIYNASTKTLFYDADGSGGGAAVAFAVLTGVNTLSASDFLIM